MRTVFKNAWPYQQDKMNLPVADVDASIPFYEKMMGFSLKSKNNSPFKSAILERDDVRIGLAENGGDPTQDGCFIEVDNVEAALAELNSNGLGKGPDAIEVSRHGETTWRVFFVVAPDGLCYCLGEKQ